MRKVIILGGSRLQLPAIRKAKKLGFYVICVDYDEDAVGFEIADQAEIISTIDMEAVLTLAKSEKPDYVITSTSDAPVRTAAYVSEKMGLPTGISYEDSLCATFKDNMRNRLLKNHIPIPCFRSCESFAQFKDAIGAIGFPCIVKPADSAASRGVRMLSGEPGLKALEAIFNETIGCSRKGTIMVEECMHGPEVSVESMTIEGKTTVLAITDKIVTEPPYVVELGHTEQSQLPEDVKAAVRVVATDTVAAIGIDNGPAHTEIMVTSSGPKVVETAARLGGDFITSKLVPLATGIDMVGSSIELALGMPVAIDKVKSCGSAIRFITSKSSGVIESIEVADELRSLPGFEEIEFYLKAGDSVSEPHSSNDRIGHIICSGSSAASAASAAEAAMGKITVKLKSPKSDKSLR